ncbi:murein transglycosylase [Klebsiella michiganensis]|nr:murein transglycosylase [Klebsiella oxytoca]MBX4645520.1 murein transglycosylase [Klebsiella michiganensis]MBX4649648.1 murein transglycosylase [Klebsiella michiganensis]MBX4662145.1 murein transglycosylase [Klebsiella michiganensis]MBX4798599.1 murein transglycosylase [Klebsiella michiganensis]
MQPFLAEIINFVKNGAYRITSSLFFAQNCLCGAEAHFISPGGLLSSSRTRA